MSALFQDPGPVVLEWSEPGRVVKGEEAVDRFLL